MIITPEFATALFTAFGFSFNKGFTGVESNVPKIALEVNSASSQQLYAWMGQFPQLREWVGDRVIQGMTSYDYFIKNKKFESTLSIPRPIIEDDQYGVFAPVVESMGRAAKQHPDRILFDLLANGFTAPCYDKQPFFSASHPGFDENGNPITVTNVQPGTFPAWFLLDTKQPVKPLVWQTRIPYKFTTIMRDEEPTVFFRDEYIYGVRARVNAGFGFWQCAFGSQSTLSAENFAEMRWRMSSLRGDQGQILGIEGNTLVCGPSNEASARLLLKATSVEATSNIWHEAAELIVTPFLP